jgi:hypothetical protein
MKTSYILAAVLSFSLAPPVFAAGGDVSVSVSPTGVLTVIGDTGDNSIAITPDGWKAFTVTGVAGTTVNHGASASMVGVLSVRVVMGAGDDRVEVNGGRIARDLRVLLDDGDDVCVLDNVKVRGRTAIRCGEGDDRVVTAGAPYFRNALNIFGQGGDDFIQLVNVTCAVRTQIDTGEGADTVNCQDSDFEDLDVRTRAGDDSLDVENCSIGEDITVDMGPDDDHLTLDNSNFDDKVDLNGGGGDNDNASVHGGNDFNHIPKLRSFES